MDIVLGYACLNTSIPNKMKTLRLATYQAKGDAYLKDLVMNNLSYVKACLEWNMRHEIDFFRVSSEMVPLATHPLMTFPWWEDRDLLALCDNIRQFATRHNMRLSMHPGQYTLLNSPREVVVQRSIEDLEYHRLIAEKLGVRDLIIHVGGLYGNRVESLDRWINVYQRLPQGIQKRLRLENDERMYSVEDVLFLSDKTGVPVVLDFHHHRILPSLDTMEAIQRTIDTWIGIDQPKFHLSSGRSFPSDPRHHDLVLKEDYDEVLEWLNAVRAPHERVYLMLEAKMKEKAVLGLRSLQ